MSGFAQVPERLLYNPGASDRAVRLYAVLARHRNADTGRCNPSRERLAELLGCSVASVKRALRELRELGEITVTAGHGAERETNSYRLLWLDSQGVTGDPLESSQRVTGDPPNGSRVTHKREQGNERSAAVLSPKDAEAFSKLIDDLGATKKQKAELAAAFTEDSAGFENVVTEARAASDRPIRLLLSKVRAGDHRLTGPASKPRNRAAEARRYAKRVSGELPARALREDLLRINPDHPADEVGQLVSEHALQAA